MNNSSRINNAILNKKREREKQNEESKNKKNKSHLPLRI